MLQSSLYIERTTCTTNDCSRIVSRRSRNYAGQVPHIVYDSDSKERVVDYIKSNERLGDTAP